MAIKNRPSFFIFLLLPLTMVAGGCARQKAVEPIAVTVTPVEEDPNEWRQVANVAGIDRLNRIDTAWDAALSEARSRGFGKAIAGEGELLEPDAALPRAALAPGPYRCRVVKIGTESGKGPAYQPFKSFFCHVAVEDELLVLVKQTGTERPAGRLYPESDERMIFLGTMALDEEDEALPYGEDAERDLAGVVERVAPFRYRLVVPWPRKDSKLDVFELIPATP
jgi:hypothetical protein